LTVEETVALAEQYGESRSNNNQPWRLMMEIMHPLKAILIIALVLIVAGLGVGYLEKKFVGKPAKITFDKESDSGLVSKDGHLWRAVIQGKKTNFCFEKVKCE